MLSRLTTRARLRHARRLWEPVALARVDASFQIGVPPERAQAMFVRDIASELTRVRQFQLVEERPGRLEFSDGIVDLAAYAGNDRGLYAELRNLTARHIHAAFLPDPEGTLVELTGHAETDVRDALHRLGIPGHWPETADDPHD